MDIVVRGDSATYINIVRTTKVQGIMNRTRSRGPTHSQKSSRCVAVLKLSTSQITSMAKVEYILQRSEEGTIKKAASRRRLMSSILTDADVFSVRLCRECGYDWKG